MSVYKRSIHEKALRKRNLHVCSEQTRFSVSWKSLGDGVSRQKKRPISLIFLEEIMASGSRDLFAKYPEDCNA